MRNHSSFLLTLSFLVLFLLGCSTSTTNGGASNGTFPQGAKIVYTTDSTNTKILGFPGTTSGNVNPSSTFSIPSNLTVSALATDSAGQIYIAVDTLGVLGTAQVLVYPANSNGSVAPSRTINLPNYAAALTVDGSGSIYVGSKVGTEGEIDVYSPTANGTASPTRTIYGLKTTMFQVNDLAVDNSGNIYAVGSTTAGSFTTSGVLFEFAATASGNVAPLRTINNGLNGLGGLFVLPNGNVGVGGYPLTDTKSNPVFVVYEFGPTATDIASATNSITVGSYSSAFGSGNMKADSNGDIYVAIPAQGSVPWTIYGFAASASGTATPFLNITSATASGNLGLIALH